MDDRSILDLFWSRQEQAIVEIAAKYGSYCHSIAFGILQDSRDANEAVNDAYLAAWNTIPPQRPYALRTYLGKLTRNLSLRKWRDRTAAKRGGGQILLALEELGDCIPAGSTPDAALEQQALAEVIDAFLRTLPTEERCIFLRRYWYLDSIRDICSRFGYGQSRVKMTLYRTRKKLLQTLEQEGFTL